MAAIYNFNAFTSRYMPYVYIVFSFIVHCKFIFNGTDDDENDPHVVRMQKDRLLKMIILYSVHTFNLIYIGIFMVLSRRDCILLHLLSWGLQYREIFTQPGKKYKLNILGLTAHTYVSILILSCV